MECPRGFFAKLDHLDHDVLDALDELSAWHSYRGEAQGQERESTFYQHRKAERAYHIDFAFNTRGMNVQPVELGTLDHYVADRISNHVPVSLTRLP